MLSFVFLKQKLDRDCTLFLFFYNNFYYFDKQLASQLFNDSIKFFSFLSCVSLQVRKKVLHFKTIERFVSLNE